MRDPAREGEAHGRAAGSMRRMRGLGLVTKLVIPDDLDPVKARPQVEAVLADAEARSFVGAIAYHSYDYAGAAADILATSGMGSPPPAAMAAREAIRDLAAPFGIPVWMTEVRQHLNELGKRLTQEVLAITNRLDMLSQRVIDARIGDQSHRKKPIRRDRAVFLSQELVPGMDHRPERPRVLLFDRQVGVRRGKVVQHLGTDPVQVLLRKALLGAP